jgi:SAM-dependent methyltransferase
MSDKTHWTQIYQSKSPDNVSWYQERPDISLNMIAATSVHVDAPIIDVGAGASTLVDFLLAHGFRDLTVLDISGESLQVVRTRLGSLASHVKFCEGDITTVELPERTYHVWHDRAVFHFLIDPASRQRYIEQVRRSVVVGGHVIVATFGEGGPEQCSGLPVRRYSADSLHSTFGPDFTLLKSLSEQHHTPWGSNQEFVYCYCRLEPEHAGT